MIGISLIWTFISHLLWNNPLSRISLLDKAISICVTRNSAPSSRQYSKFVRSSLVKLIYVMYYFDVITKNLKYIYFSNLSILRWDDQQKSAYSNSKQPNIEYWLEIWQIFEDRTADVQASVHSNIDKICFKKNCGHLDVCNSIYF